MSENPKAMTIQQIQDAIAKRDSFRDDLAALINSHSMENASSTPDYILADYLVACLTAYEHAARERRRCGCVRRTGRNGLLRQA